MFCFLYNMELTDLYNKVFTATKNAVIPIKGNRLDRVRPEARNAYPINNAVSRQATTNNTTAVSGEN